MAKVIVDESLCTGCGLCENTCSEVFKIEDNVAKVISEDTALCDVNQAVEDCPVNAIIVEEEEEE